jgi:hypothetical protein
VCVCVCVLWVIIYVKPIHHRVQLDFIIVYVYITDIIRSYYYYYIIYYLVDDAVYIMCVYIYKNIIK